MKNLIKSIALCIALAPATVAAQGSTELCGMFGDLAEVTMQNRQNGVALSTVMATANGVPMIEAIILAAYQQPRWSSDANQENAVRDFRNDVEFACYSNSGEAT